MAVFIRSIYLQDVIIFGYLLVNRTSQRFNGEERPYFNQPLARICLDRSHKLKHRFHAIVLESFGVTVKNHALYLFNLQMCSSNWNWRRVVPRINWSPLHFAAELRKLPRCLSVWRSDLTLPWRSVLTGVGGQASMGFKPLPSGGSDEYAAAEPRTNTTFEHFSLPAYAHSFTNT